MARLAEIDTSRISCDGGGVGLVVALFSLVTGFGTLCNELWQIPVLLALLVAAAGLLVLVRRGIRRWFPPRQQLILLKLGDLETPPAQSTPWPVGGGRF